MTAKDETSHRAWKPTKAELAFSTLSGILFIAEIIVCFFFYYNYYVLDILLYLGWAFLILGFIIMSLPRTALRTHGQIPEGKSWVHTTVVVDSGIYGIVRHPIYVGWIIDILALMLISQYWITIAFGTIPFLSVVHYTFMEDMTNREKFGDSYIEYSERVPMMNFMLGLVRYLRRREEKEMASYT